MLSKLYQLIIYNFGCKFCVFFLQYLFFFFKSISCRAWSKEKGTVRVKNGCQICKHITIPSTITTFLIYYTLWIYRLHSATIPEYNTAIQTCTRMQVPGPFSSHDRHSHNHKYLQSTKRQMLLKALAHNKIVLLLRLTKYY